MPGTRCINRRELRSLVEGFRKDHGAAEGGRLVLAHLTEALENKNLRPADFSIADIFEATVDGGAGILEHWRNPKSGRGGPLLEAAGGAAVGYSDFSNITGQIFFTEVKQNYEDEEFVFSKEVESKGSTIQDIEKIPNITRTGKTRKKLAEGDPYPRVGVGEDYIEAPAKVKDGAIVEVTKEAVAGDKTGILLDRCGELGWDLGYDIESRTIDALIDENDGATGAYSGGHRYTWRGTAYATFQGTSPWVNVKTSNPLTDETSIDAVWQVLAAIKDPFTNRPILIRPDSLVVTPNLYFRALRIIGATEVRQNAPGYATSGSPVQTVSAPALSKVMPTCKVLTSRLLKDRLATDTDWFLSSPRRQVRRYYIWDVTTSQRGAGTDAEFERDVVMQFKASVKDCVTTMEPRVSGKSSA